jgi:acyl-CoA synthetase (AMP-forming)/AMP-acid ligase II
MANSLDFSEFDFEPSTLIEILRWRALHQPDQRAYAFLSDGESQGAHLSYAELDLKARAIGALLQEMKLAGERVLLLYPPGLEYIAALFGCFYAQAIAVPAYPPLRNHSLARIEAIAADAQATVALTTGRIQSDIERRFAQEHGLVELSWLAMDEDNLENDLAEAWHAPEVHAGKLALLQYTSGSTGKPKGVMVSHGNLLHNLAMIHQCFEHTPQSRGVIWLPPYHDMGLIGGILQALYGRIPVVLMPPVAFLQKPLRWLQAITRYRATTSGGPNFAYELCIRKIKPEQKAGLDLSSWEVAFTGAEPVRAETIERFSAAFASCGFRREAFYPCYGMAEATLIVSGGVKSNSLVVRQIEAAALEQNRVVATSGKQESARTIVGCGQTTPDQKIVIVDPETHTLCPPGKVGEIWVCGPSVTRGYWNRPPETEETFRAYLADTGEGPFLRTGDLGFIDEELFVTGRIKDVIIIRGRNHYPQDVELTVEQSHPALLPGCGAAFSVEIDGEERLVVVQEVARTYLRKLDANEVVQDIRQAVAQHHQLQVHSVLLLNPGSIPKTSSGKIQRQACWAEFLSGRLNAVNAKCEW